MTAFISLRVARVSRQMVQNAVESSLAVEVPLGDDVVLGVDVLLGAEVPLVTELSPGAALPAWLGLPHADSPRVRATMSSGAASRASRPVVRDVRFMPV
jgi:hypothetical protein